MSRLVDKKNPLCSYLGEFLLNSNPLTRMLIEYNPIHLEIFLMFHILGNEALHLLTSGAKQELRVDLEKFSGKKAYAKYSIFSVGSGSDKYKLTVGGYRGTAGKSIRKKEK